MNFKIDPPKTLQSLSTIVVLFAAILGLSACTSYKEKPIIEGDLVIYDPYESYNRNVFAFNQSVDSILINPAIKGYRFIAPNPVRKGVRSFLRNLKSPIIFINEVLQGDLDGAKNTVVRTAINSTVGLGGIIDLAGYNGIEYEGEDFGQTLAVWGVDHGPYMMVPFLGPSSLRDYSGYFADGLADPLRWYLFNIDRDPLYYSKVVADYFDLRESLYNTLKDINETSFDSYAATRSIYYQNRAAMVRDLDPSAMSTLAPSIPDYDDEDW